MENFSYSSTGSGQIEATEVPALTAEELKEMRKTLSNLYRHGPVVSLNSVRYILDAQNTFKLGAGSAFDKIVGWYIRFIFVPIFAAKVSP